MDPRAVLRQALLELDPAARWGRIVVAASGGADSTALLHLLVDELRPRGVDLVVAHADHAQHPGSAVVAREVAMLASRFGCRFRSVRLALDSGAGETAAREARLAWLEGIRLEEGADAVALAHHAGDQAETVLLRTLHGSGPAGLAGMAPRRASFVRPLLKASHESLVAHCSAAGLTWWEDPANADPRHIRSWLRTEALPLVRERLPGADRALLDVARQAAQARSAWDQVPGLLPGLDIRDEPDGGSFRQEAWAALPPEVAIQVLLAMARRVGCRLGGDRAEAFRAWLDRAAAGRVMELGAGWIGCHSGGRAYLARPWTPPEPATLEAPEGSLHWGAWRVTWRPHRAGPARRDGWRAWLDRGPLTLRGPHAGDRLRPLGGQGHRPVVRLLQDSGVPAFRRRAWPVLERQGAPLWVAGICRGELGLPRDGATALEVQVEPRPGAGP